MKKHLVLNFLLIFIAALSSEAQNIIASTVADSSDQRPLAYVSVRLNEGLKGTSSNFEGRFTIEALPGKNEIYFSHVGYETRKIIFESGNGSFPDTVFLKQDDIFLDEVSIISSVAEERRSPVSISTIKTKEIQTQLGDQPFPNIMNTIPGVYSTRYGGGSGDARINIRGFQQENIALLLNGIPISSVENGLVYWNNWLGLSEATNFIQVQKGLGTNKVALNSVGGTINIVTQTTGTEKGGSLYFSATDYGNTKTTLSLSSGRLDNGLSVSFLGSRVKGPGYVDATYVDSWAYFLSIGKEFGSKHKLVFTALGAPERHGQRNFMLTREEVDRHGLKFNKDWGSYNGKLNNLSVNFYHKPYINFNHYWQLSKNTFITNAAYISPGYGGGKWSDSFMAEKSIFAYRNPSCQIDFGSIYQNNYNNNDYYVLSNGDSVSGYSKNIQTDFLASHIWTGLVSTIEHQLSDQLKVSGGFHYRFFQSKLQQKVRDLLGGDFYIDNYAWAIEGRAGRPEIKEVGDIIKVDNGAIIHFANVFGGLEYEAGNLTVSVSGSIYNNSYQRLDRYNYVEDIKSDVISMSGFDVKAGANYNLNEFHNVFFNAGYYSRVPYYKFVFARFTNEASRDLGNEKISSVEAGYGFIRKKTKFSITAYRTLWEDRSLLANEYKQFLDPVMIRGLDALHQGIEISFSRGFGNILWVNAFLSGGDWKWQNDVSALVYSQQNVVTDTVEIFADGLYVGGAPQLQFGLSAKLNLSGTTELSANWLFYDDLYASFNPTQRSDPQDNSQPYRMPEYNVLDAHLVQEIKLFGQKASAGISCYNLLNHKFIVRGEDGATHDLNSFRGFWGFGRNFAFSVKIDI